MKEYLKKKKETSAIQATFPRNIFAFFDSVIGISRSRNPDCYVEMSQKLKVELERKKQHESSILTHIEETIGAAEAIRELKDMKNSEIGLFGISKRTEQEYIQTLNRARQNLFAVP
jgi:hypothetical protein